MFSFLRERYSRRKFTKIIIFLIIITYCIISGLVSYKSYKEYEDVKNTCTETLDTIIDSYKVVRRGINTSTGISVSYLHEIEYSYNVNDFWRKDNYSFISMKEEKIDKSNIVVITNPEHTEYIVEYFDNKDNDLFNFQIKMILTVIFTLDIIYNILCIKGYLENEYID